MALVLDGNGPITGLSSLTFPGGSGTVSGLATAGIPSTKIGTGAVLQVVSAIKTDTFSSTSATNVDITGLSVSITPSSATSKILVFVQGNYGPSIGSQIVNFQLVRDSTNIATPTNTGLLYSSTVSAYQTTSDQTANYSIIFLDSPATTSATTYKVQGRSAGASTWYVNRRNTADMNTISTITVMEIAG